VTHFFYPAIDLHSNNANKNTSTPNAIPLLKSIFLLSEKLNSMSNNLYINYFLYKYTLP